MKKIIDILKLGTSDCLVISNLFYYTMVLVIPHLVTQESFSYIVYEGYMLFILIFGMIAVVLAAKDCKTIYKHYKDFDEEYQKETCSEYLSNNGTWILSLVLAWPILFVGLIIQYSIKFYFWCMHTTFQLRRRSYNLLVNVVHKISMF